MGTSTLDPRARAILIRVVAASAVILLTAGIAVLTLGESPILGSALIAAALADGVVTLFLATRE